ncbi:MAG: hypothetical protein ACLGSH_14955 [Acidobacteriota bacterium]
MSESSSRCPECRHIMPGGRKCHALALKDKPFCHAHLRRSALIEANRARQHSVALPPLEDWAAIQMSLDEILAAFAAHKISRREAGTYLFAIQIASRNPHLDRVEMLPAPGAGPLAPDGRAEPPANPTEPSPAEPGAGAPEPIALSPAPSPDNPPTPASGALADPPLPIHEPGASDSHEKDPEPPLPLTRAQRRQRRIDIQRDLRNYYEGRRYYEAQPADLPGSDCAIVLAHLKANIDKLEAELEALNRQDAQDLPEHRAHLMRESPPEPKPRE